MKKNLFLFAAIFFIALLAGCQDEVVQVKSPGEKIGEEIMAYAKSKNTTRVKLRNTSWRTEFLTLKKIEGEIMYVDTGNTVYHFNLNYVHYYSLDVDAYGSYIYIWFITPQVPLH